MKKERIIAVILGVFLFSQPLALLAQDSGTITVSEKHLAMMPCKYEKQNIVTEAVFMDVSNTLLDDIYHDADTRFSSREYLNFRTMGNGMYHYFIKQSDADIIPTLKTGDKVVISGFVTSCVDRHAWVEVDSLRKVSGE
jgi:hypothetical protein